MKLIILILPLIVFGFFAGAISKKSDCFEIQVKNYGDICAESSSGYEQMSGSDAHFEGVKCAVKSIKACLGN